MIVELGKVSVETKGPPSGKQSEGSPIRPYHEL